MTYPDNRSTVPHIVPRYETAGVFETGERQRGEAMSAGAGYFDKSLLLDEWTSLWTDLGGEG